MALSQKNHKIKHRENPNDVFITPLALAKTHIDMIKTKKNWCWYVGVCRGADRSAQCGLVD